MDDHTTAEADPRRWQILAVLVMSLLLVAIDATILNVALPTLAGELRPSSTELLWIVDVYSLVLAGLLVTFGTLGDRLGRRRMLMTGFAAFGAASLLAAFAGSPAVLIAARVLLGLGAAMIMPSTLSIIRNLFLDPRERALALGVWAATASAGTAIGPIVGGALLEAFWWGSVFLVNVPIVVAAFVLAARLVPESRDPNPGRWDAASAALSLVAMVALVFGIKHVGKHGLDDPAGVAALVGGAAGLAVFVRRQLRLPAPLIDVRLFRSRSFSTATATVLLAFFAMFGVLFLLTQYLQLVLGHSPLEAGVDLLPLAVASAVAGVLADRLVRSAGARTAVGLGFVLVAGGMALMATLDASSTFLPVAAGLGLLGGGLGVAVTAGSATILGAAPPERAGGAAAIQETAFELGGGVGIAVLGTIMAGVYRSGLDLPAGLDAGAADAAREGLPTAAEAATAVGGEAGAALLAGAQAAFLDGFGTTMLVAAGVAGTAAVVAALFLPGREPRAARRLAMAAAAEAD